MLRYWWVNHKQTYAQETSGHFIWSPVTKANGQRNQFYDNMKLVQPGDIVFSFANTAIRAIGVATGSAALLPKPSDFGKAGDAWGTEGWMVPVQFSLLKTPIYPRNHMDVLAPTLPAKYSPIAPNGNGNQVAYLAELPPAMVTVLEDLLADQWGVVTNLQNKVLTNPEAVLEDEDNVVAEAIRNRTDIGETERQQLVRSRRGQGIYRKNLEAFEACCRITGLADLKHLRASHIKPWKACSDFEKLDGNNGLLLSPHVDHLFDRGFISFNDDGTLVLSKELGADVLQRWHIPANLKVASFRTEQLPYLDFHRECVFKG